MSVIKYTMIALLGILAVVIMGLEGNGLGLALAVMISGLVCCGLFICLVKIEAFDFPENSELERLNCRIR